MKKTVYKLNTTRLSEKLRIALVSDLHDTSCGCILDTLKAIKPDIIAVAGDLTSRLDCAEGVIAPEDNGKPVTHKEAMMLLRGSVEIAPTYYSLGNHELCGHYYRRNPGRKCLEENLQCINKSGAVLLDDSYVTTVGGIRIGGLTSGLTNLNLQPHTEWLEKFTSCDEFKILLCHHPEYYEKYLRQYNIDLILSGHAHGGQISLFGHGLFAPSQGIFPKYTSGVHENRLVIGRGLANTVKPIPRLFNPREIVIVDINPENFT